MRVLVVTNMYPPHHLGGYELSCRDTVERFVERGHEVMVLTSTLRFPGVTEPEGTAAPVRRELDIYWRDHEIVRPPLRECLAMERRSQQALAAALDDVRPDVVSFWNMGALSLGLLTTVLERAVPSVLVVCDDWLVSAPLIDGWASRTGRRPIDRIVRRLTGVPTRVADLGRVSAMCFVSESTRRTAADNTKWTFPRTTVTGSGIDHRDFPVTSPDAGPSEWAGRLLFAGRAEARKGIETAIRALPLCGNGAILEVVGPIDEGYRAHLRTLVEASDVADRVTFASVERSGLRAHYLDADAVLFPSEWAEPFGLVPLEAMACRRPVVATGTGGSGEFLRDGENCLLHPPGDAAALAAAVRRLGSDPALRATLVDGGVRVASHLSTDRLADVLEEWHVAAAAGFVDGEPAPRPLV